MLLFALEPKYTSDAAVAYNGDKQRSGISRSFATTRRGLSIMHD